MVTGWRLHHFAPGEGLAQGAHLAAHDDADWLPIEVPGDVQKFRMRLSLHLPLKEVHTEMTEVWPGRGLRF